MATTTTAFYANTTGYAALERLLATAYNSVVTDGDTTRAGRTALNLAGTGDYTASASEYEKPVLEGSGLLTGNRSLILPLIAGAWWWIYNNTTGSYTLTAKGSSGTGIVILQGCAAQVWTDGTNFLRATADVEQDGDLGTNTVPVGAIEDSGLTGQKAAVLADVAVIGGLPVLHRIDVAAGTTGTAASVTLTYKTRICEVWLVKTGAAGGGAGTISVGYAANLITNAMSIDVADQTVVRAGTIDDAYHDIAAAGELRVVRTRTASTSEACTVYVLGVRVA